MAGTSRKRQNTEDARKKETVRKAASSGKTGSSRKAEPAKSRKKPGKAAGKEPEINSFMGTEVAIIVTFAVSVLLFLSNFGLCGAVGDALRKGMLGVFGGMGYIAPILLFVGICFYLSNRGNRRAIIKIVAVVAVLLALCGLDQLIFGGGLKEGWTAGQYYAHSASEGSGGGFLGGLLVMGFGNLVGTVGTWLVLLVLLAIGAVGITERSLVNFVKRGSGRAYEYAKEDMNRRKELYEERREEKKRLREEQRVRGVDLDAANLTDIPLMREFASGIPEGTVLSGDSIPKERQTEETEIREDGDLREESQSGQTAAFGGAKEENRETFESNVASEPVNPADVFRGEIHGPGMRKLEETPEDNDQDQLLKKLYIRRDMRTMEELSGIEEEIPSRGPGYHSVHTSGRPVPEEAALFWEEEAESCGQSEIPEQPEQFEIEAADERADENLEEVRPERWKNSQEESWEEILEEEEPEDGYYKTMETGGNGEEKRFFVPEEAKTVVTSSGKRIETDTEEVRKMLEKKRESQKTAPESELTVRQQVERKEEQEKEKKREYVFPPLSLLKRGSGQTDFSAQEYRDTAIKLQQTLQNFGVGVTVTNISCGPSVTRYELHPEQGVKVSRIVALADDIKLNLAAADIRIEAPIPGKAAVGIEVPNKENHVVLLRDLLEAEEFRRHPSKVAFAVGKDIAGQVVVSDIAKMPHLLIAGATGSGKSVCINTLIMSVIYKARPEDVKLIMIDPKVVELSVYNGIPHLLIPVVTDPKKASGALNWAVAEMTDRYQRFAKYNVRDLKGYNAKVDAIADVEDEKKPERLPQIIIIVDELADLMMVAPGEVEDSICRLAQLARAAGIHLVIATQRPSVNVITGVIKANIPSRIAFSVSSGVDSRTIIDMNGAEKLLGKGDMLFYPSGYQKPQRVQGAFVSDNEVSAVVEFLTEQGMTAQYSPEVESRISTVALMEGAASGVDRDAYFVQAGRFIIEKDKASIGMLQRMFKIGFNRAARIMDQLAEAGVVGEEEGTKPRKVLMTMEQFENQMEEQG